MNPIETKRVRRARRVMRVRKGVTGTAQRPRLCVSRSNQNLLVQLIDDVAGRTVCAISSLQKALRASAAYGGNCKAAAAIGKELGEKATALGISEVCFDRRGYRYHGRIKALAEAARAAGLKF
ncbi:MAG: 50S ribosomal protein L18 [Planctomycetes bacterium]|nr:50S ribosomal protein L18 [Planctomycetota bacterium]